MRRDIGFYVEANIQQVYHAYLAAAKGKPFERDCKEVPYHLIAFGVNASIKYNMNGGSCNIHLMPSGTGTAVNMRFSIAQAVGARYEKYANDLNEAMRKILPVVMRQANYNMDDFMNPKNQVTPANFAQPAPQPAPQAVQIPAPQPAPQVVYTPAPQPAPAPQVVSAPAPQPAPAARPAAKFCSQCGNPLDPGDRFCAQCGKPVSSVKTCPNCGVQARENAVFCPSCGTRL